jgi:hypothetical protein
VIVFWLADGTARIVDGVLEIVVSVGAGTTVKVFGVTGQWATTGVSEGDPPRGTDGGVVPSVGAGGDDRS